MHCDVCLKNILDNEDRIEIRTGQHRHDRCSGSKPDFTPPANNIESVNHPKHYGGADNVYETIKIIEALGHGESFCIGNALKYICRYKNKNGVEDLRKAVWYINRVIEQHEK